MRASQFHRFERDRVTYRFSLIDISLGAKVLNDEDKSTTATYMIHPCKEILSSAVHVRITYFYEKKLYYYSSKEKRIRFVEID